MKKAIYIKTKKHEKHNRNLKWSFTNGREKKWHTSKKRKNYINFKPKMKNKGKDIKTWKVKIWVTSDEKRATETKLQYKR